MKNPKSILFVAYLSPPCGGVGTVRITKFIKYLKLINWNITLITIKEKYYHQINEDWLKDIESVNIIRTDIAEARIPGINEHGIYWYFKLKKELNSILSNNTYDISFWTGGPFSQLYLAPWAHRKYGLKYIIDLRDPWALNPYSPKTKLASLRKILFSKMERSVMRDASIVLNVTEEASGLYKKYYKEHTEKFMTIPNGYDPDDFRNINSKRISDFDIVYTGSFRHFRDPSYFFKALKKFIEVNKIRKGELCFIWIGEIEQHIKEKIELNNLVEFVHYTGFIPYSDAIQYVKGSNIGVLIAGDHPFEPTTKIFDYLGLNIPILAIIKSNGFISRTLENISNTWVVKNDADEIFACIQKCFKQCINQNQTPDDKSAKNIEVFDRSKHAQKLNRILEECMRH